MTEARTWSWLRFDRQTALLLLAGLLAIGVWQGNAVYFSIRADGRDTVWGKPIVWELTGSLAAYLSAWIPFTATKNARRPRGAPLRFAVIHLMAYALYAGLKTALMLGSRWVLYPLLGWGAYGYSGPAFRLAMEWHKDVITYVVLALGFGLIASWQESRRRELREAQLAAELKAAQLQVLTQQLNPHFLFNALNTVSSVMYSDLEKTDRLLSDLGQVLRASLSHGAAPTWSLAEERAHTERYLAVMLARFGDRLSVTWSVDNGVEGTQVPRFALQLLVENALKHNLESLGALQVQVGATRRNGALVLEVRDNGRGFGGAAEREKGFGLKSLERALALCHGPAAVMTLSNAEGGGARVELEVPVEARS